MDRLLIIGTAIIAGLVSLSFPTPASIIAVAFCLWIIAAALIPEPERKRDCDD